MWRAVFSLLVTAGFVAAAVGPVSAQDATKASNLGTPTVTGTVKSAAPDGFVVRGVEQNKEREWAFSLDDRTAVRKNGQTAAKADLREGDRVTVNYTERDGKIVAQSVTVGGATGSR